MTGKRLLATATVVGVLTVTTTASLTGHAGAGDRPAKTIPTLPPTSTVGPEDTGSVAASTDVVIDPVATGISLRAGAGLPEIFPVVRAVLGPTADVAARLGELADVPENIQSPLGSVVREFEITYFGVDRYFVASATFTSTATAGDTVTFYQATLTAARFVPTEDSGPVEGDPASRTLRFETPESPYEDANVEVVVTDGDEVDVELTITDAADADVLQAFTGWAAGLPTLTEAEPIEATIHVVSDPDTLTLSTQFGYDDYTADDLASAIRSALPDGPFQLDPEVDEDGSTTIGLQHVILEDVSCEITSDETYPAVLSLSGTRQI